MSWITGLFTRKSQETVSVKPETDFLMVACDNLISREELDFVLSSYDDVEASSVMVASPANPFFNVDWEDHVGIEWPKNHWVLKCPVELSDKILAEIDMLKLSKASAKKANKLAVTPA